MKEKINLILLGFLAGYFVKEMTSRVADLQSRVTTVEFDVKYGIPEKIEAIGRPAPSPSQPVAAPEA